MKSKRLIIWIAIVAVILVLLIVLSVVFSVRDAYVVFHRYDGQVISSPQDAPTIKDVLQIAKGKNIFFLSKSETLKQLQRDNWHAISIVKEFPNKITVHFVERALAVKVLIGGQDVFVDSKGNVMAKQEGVACVDITSALSAPVASSQVVNQPLVFTSSQNNERLQQILQVVLAMWRCNVDLPNISAVLGEKDVFTYQDNNLHITMPSGAKIVVHAPSKDLQERMIDAFSVYYNNDGKNLQQSGVIITVREDGKITTDK